MATKTNAQRQLDKAGVKYWLRDFPIGKEHLDAEAIAALVGLAPERVYKTLVARGDKSGPLFAVISANRSLDLKALARLSDNRKVALVPLAEVTPLTGYVRGSTTALAAKKRFPVFLHEEALGHETICVSAGRRGLQIELAPRDYLAVTGAVAGQLAADPA